jgi:hypothetical protein
MAGKNFPTNKEDVLVPTYYLDIDGLAGFWAKAKQYINNQNLSLNGQNIPLYPRGTESNVSITSAITNIKNQYVKDVGVYIPKNDYISCVVTPDESGGEGSQEGKQTKITLNPAGLIEKFNSINSQIDGIDEVLPNAVLHDEVSPTITAENNQLSIEVAGHKSNTVSVLTTPHADAATQINVLSSVSDVNYPLVGTENKTTGGSGGGGIGQYTVRNLYIQAEKNEDGSITQSELYINPSKKLVSAPNIKSNNVLSSIITSRSYEDTLNEDHDEIIIGHNRILFSGRKNKSYPSITFAGVGGQVPGSWCIHNVPGSSLDILHTNPVYPEANPKIFGIDVDQIVEGRAKYSIKVAGDIMPNPQNYTAQTFDIGDSKHRFNNSYIDNGFFINGTFGRQITSPLGQFSLLDATKIKTNAVTASGKYYPLVLQTNDKPESGYSFGYIDSLSFDQASKTVNIGGNNGIEYCPSTYSLNPVQSGSQSLGTSSKKWQEIYVESVKSHGSSYFKDIAIQSYAWPADLTASYQEPVTNGYIRNIINTNDLSQYGIPHDPTQDYLEIGLENYTTFTDEGVMSEYPASPLRIYRDKLYFQDTCIVGSDGEIGLKDHTHAVTYTPSGSVSSSFSAGSVSVNASSGTTTVKSVKSVGSVPTRTSKSMPKSSHTHAVTYTPSGSVSSSFSNGSVSVNASSGTTSVASSGHTHTIDLGDLSSTFTGTATTVPATSTTGTTVASQKHTHTASESALSVSYSNGVLTITTSHNHSVPGTSTSGVTVAGQNHTHSVTPTGTVSFTGDDITTGTPSGTTSVASSGHTHTGTVTGTVTSTFTGTEGTATAVATPSTECETIYSITGVGSTPTTEDVTVASSGHTHTGTVTGTVTSTFTGTEDTVTSDFAS